MADNEHTCLIRVRYSETDQMGTYYNSRALEWFECGRTELLRALGKPYSQWEAMGVMLPITVAHVEYFGKAQYDDLLKMTTRASMAGRARVRFDVQIDHADTHESICRGHTIHAVTDTSGRPTRPPGWLVELFG